MKHTLAQRYYDHHANFLNGAVLSYQLQQAQKAANSSRNVQIIRTSNLYTNFLREYGGTEIRNFKYMYVVSLFIKQISIRTVGKNNFLYFDFLKITN